MGAADSTMAGRKMTGPEYYRRVEEHFELTGEDMSNSGYLSRPDFQLDDALEADLERISSGHSEPELCQSEENPYQKSIKNTGPEYQRRVEEHFELTGEDISNSGYLSRRRREQMMQQTSSGWSSSVKYNADTGMWDARKPNTKTMGGYHRRSFDSEEAANDWIVD